MDSIKEVELETAQGDSGQEFNELKKECDACHRSFKVGINVVEQPLERVPGYGMIHEVGIRCPNCEKFYFAAFVTDSLKRRRTSLDRLWERTENGENEPAFKQYIKAKMGYKRQFDRFNINMSKRFDREWQGNVK
jgi:hypothetical protein